MPNRSIRATQAQIDHIKANYAAFTELFNGEQRDVEQYFREYGHITDLYERLCSDMDLTPIKE